MVLPFSGESVSRKRSISRRSSKDDGGPDPSPGRNLRRLRTAKRLSVAVLAEIARLSPVEIAEIEAGAEPALETLWALAFALDVPFLELVKEAGPEGSSGMAKRRLTGDDRGRG